jgi:hypothetical protein
MGSLRLSVLASVLVSVHLAFVPSAAAQAVGGVEVKVFILAGQSNLLPTKAESDEYRARSGHWYCHDNGSAATCSLIGLALAESLAESLVGAQASASAAKAH